MFGLGALFVLILLIFLFKWFATSNIPKAIKYPVIFLFLSCPFWFYIYPSYHQFVSLCEAGDRSEVFRQKEVDYIYMGRSSRCIDGFKYLADYTGFECEYGLINGTGRSKYRYIKGDSWSTPSCSIDCFELPNDRLNKECLLSCTESVDIKEFTNHFTQERSYKPLVHERLYEHKTKFIDDREIMAVHRSYTYYHYGRGWAKILGLASGQAPSIHCDNNAYKYNTDIYKPKSAGG